MLLDIKVKEQTEESLARGGGGGEGRRKVYEPPRFMSVPTALEQMREVENERKEGTLDPHKTLLIALSRMGAHPPQPSSSSSPSFDGERIVAGTLHDLLSVPVDDRPRVFGPPLHSLIVVGKRLHVLEAEFAETFAVDQQNWRRVAREVYGCEW